MGIKEGTCSDDCWVLYVSDEPLVKIGKGKKCRGKDFDRIELQIPLSSVAMLTTSNLTIHEYGGFSPPRKSPLISSSNGLYFSVPELCFSWNKFMPKYFIVLGALVRE